MGLRVPMIVGFSLFQIYFQNHDIYVFTGPYTFVYSLRLNCGQPPYISFFFLKIYPSAFGLEMSWPRTNHLKHSLYCKRNVLYHPLFVLQDAQHTVLLQYGQAKLIERHVQQNCIYIFQYYLKAVFLYLYVSLYFLKLTFSVLM